MPQSRNIFRCLNKDLAKTKLQAYQSTAKSVTSYGEYYDDALDIRLVTDSGTSTGTVANIRGNSYAFTIPNTGSVWQITNFPTTGYSSIAVAINTFKASTPWIVPVIGNIYDSLAVYLNTNYTSLGIVAYSNQVSVTLYSSTLIDITTLFLSSTVGPAGITLGSTNKIIAAQTNLVPIGYTVLRDTIILLTTSSLVNIHTGVNPSQIWTVTYDKALLQNINQPTNVPGTPNGIFTLTLKYNNLLDFSTASPVAPNAIVANYEEPTIQKIYWCDFYYDIRSFNIADPNGFFIDPSLFSIVSKTTLDIPVITGITSGGQLPCGIYYYTYQLNKLEGTSTPWAPFSPGIEIVADTTIDVNYPTQTGTLVTTITTKTINGYISNIDTSYDTINIAYARKQSLEATADNTAMFLTDIPINKTSGTYTFSHSGTSSTNKEVPITLTEIVTPTATIRQAKTLVSKDNMLLLGNVKASNRTVINSVFRPIALRYNYNKQTYSNVDNINPNQTANAGSYLYQSDGVTLGGGDPTFTTCDVAYTFSMTKIPFDFPGAKGLTGPPYVQRGASATNWEGFSLGTTSDTFKSKTVTGTQLTYDGRTYVASDSNVHVIDSGSPYLSTTLRGFQRDETYRFGIQFFDKSGYAYFVQWIGDIKMPSIYMPVGNTSNLTCAFPLSQYDPNATTYSLNSLNINFKINVTSKLLPYVSGYSIVRVKRSQQDKTVLAVGLLEPAETFIDDMSVSGNSVARPYLQSFKSINYSIPKATHMAVASLISPETTYGVFDGINWAQNDYIKVIDCLQDVNYVSSDLPKGGDIRGYNTGAFFGQPTYGATGGGQNIKPYGYIAKYYNTVFANGAGTASHLNTCITVNNTSKISSFFDNPNTGGWDLNSSGINPIPNLQTAYNTNGLGSYSQRYAIQGGPVQGLRLANNSVGKDKVSYVDSLNNRFYSYDNFVVSTNYFTLLGVNELSARPLISYNRQVTNQYGGNTNQAKSNNTYISCNQYQPVTSVGVYNNTIFSGDTYVNLVDENTKRKALRGGTDTQPYVQSLSNPGGSSFSISYFYVTETCINTNLRQKNGSFNSSLNVTGVNNQFFWVDGSGNYQITTPNKDFFSGYLNYTENFNYNTSFLNENDLVSYIPTPIPFVEVDTFDSRIANSEVKINGELTDSWSIFKPNAYHDVDSIYGPINNLSVSSNRLFFWQDSAFGYQPVNRKVLQPDGSNTELVLGTGSTLDKHEYISTKHGSKHQWSILTTDKGFYWYDVLSNKQIRYTGEGVVPLSDTKGMHSFFDKNIKYDILKTDNPLNGTGISCYYDYKYNEAIHTYLDGTNGIKKTLAYSDHVDGYTTFYSATPSLYVTDKYIALSSDPSNPSNFYVHDYGNYGQFYNQSTYTAAYIKFLVGESAETTKTFNNLILQTEVSITGVDTSYAPNFLQESVTAVRYSTDYQNTGAPTPLVVGTNLRRKFRSWYLEVGRDVTTQPEGVSPALQARLRDKYMYVELWFQNNSNKKFVLHDVYTGYTPAPY